MPETLEAVLRMVEEGRLTADEAASILAALEGGPEPAGGSADTGGSTDSGGPDRSGWSEPGGSDRGRWVKVEVSDGGRTIVNLKLPASLGEAAMGRIPGLAGEELVRIREALRTGLRGEILRVLDADGSGVRIIVD